MIYLQPLMYPKLQTVRVIEVEPLKDSRSDRWYQESNETLSFSPKFSTAWNIMWKIRALGTIKNTVQIYLFGRCLKRNAEILAIGYSATRPELGSRY